MDKFFLHIFVHLIDNNHDKYIGIKQQLSQKSNHIIKELRLSKKSVETFNKVEFSNRKFFREFYYSNVFKEIENKLIDLINSNKDFTFVYIKDEGVWSEYLRFFIKKNKLDKLKLVNVQHGFLMRNTHSSLRTSFINLINSFYNHIFGFPKFGIGPFKGPFNYYLLFHSELCKETLPGVTAIACPNLINRSFIDNYRNTTNNVSLIDKSILIALPYYVRFGFYSLNFKDLLKSLIPLINDVNENHGYQIFLRKHPGMKKPVFLQNLRELNLLNKVNVDDSNLETSINRSPYIFSFNSTILFEASLINRIPVIIDNKSFDLSGFPIKYKIIDTDQNITKQLGNIFKIKPTKNNLNDEINWPEYIERKI